MNSITVHTNDNALGLTGQLNRTALQWLAVVMLISAFVIPEKLQNSSADASLSVVANCSVDIQDSLNDDIDPDHGIANTFAQHMPLPPETAIVARLADELCARYYAGQPRAPPIFTA